MFFDQSEVEERFAFFSSSWFGEVPDLDELKGGDADLQVLMNQSDI